MEPTTTTTTPGLVTSASDSRVGRRERRVEAVLQRGARVGEGEHGATYEPTAHDLEAATLVMKARFHTEEL
jgi:hypothetical protein